MSNLSRDSLTYYDGVSLDLLQDYGFQALQYVSKYTNFEITSQYLGRPDLISYDFYRTTDLFWAILAFNGIYDLYDIYEGETLKIPDANQLMLALSRIKSVTATKDSKSAKI